VTASVVADNSHVRFLVKDDGPGIPAEDMPRIFERFYRGRNAGTEGAGLGLAIVQSVANAHAGRIDVQSAPGGGSTFILEIPAAAASS
jgi:signal transduction histidine kinase